MSFNICSEEITKSWRAKTDERISNILNSPNMDIPDGADVYYLSNNGNDELDGKTQSTAWRTLEKLNCAQISRNSYVCFERGGLWRGQIAAKEGVTYTAFGKGEKPRIYSSPLDGARSELWTKTHVENIWQFSESFELDVGTIVFDHGKSHAIKCIIRTEKDGSTYNNTTGEPFKSFEDLTTDLHFYHDYKDTGIIYLYSERNPGERFQSIEFNIKRHVVAVGASTDVTVDNLCIKYCGSHGVGAASTERLTVKNCEFGWIGGSIQGEHLFGRNAATRYGNAIEIYGRCDTFTATDNYIYQVYDAGITQQFLMGNYADQIWNQKNVYYARNVIEYCNYSIEYFLSGCPKENPTRMENFVIEDNYMWYSGIGLCNQRPDKRQGAHIKGWSGPQRNRATGYVIRNNLMHTSNDMVVQIMSDLYNPDGSDSMPSFSGNVVVAKKGGVFGTVAMNDVTAVPYDESVVEYIGEKSDGTDEFLFL